MSLLFDDPLIAGLRYQENVISEPEERALVERLDGLDLAPFRFHGWLGNRKTQSFGWRYDFDDASFMPAEPIPEWLQEVRASAAAFAGLQPGDFVHVLARSLRSGRGHRLAPRPRRIRESRRNFVEHTSDLRFRQRTESGFHRANLVVPPRSAYLLSGEARHDWEHSISPQQSRRFSITFRTLSEKGRRIARP